MSPITFSYANSNNSASYLKELIRPYLINIIGEKFTISVLGNDSSKIILPKIPEMKSNAKSVEEYQVSEKIDMKYTSDELNQFNYNFIVELFEVTKGFSPNENDASKWMNVLNQGASYEGVYRAMVLDQTYYGLESMGSPANKSTVLFSMNYLQEYVGTNIKKASLEESNFYTLKRVSVEKTLEIMDALSKNKEDVLNWYSVLSSDLANKYPNTWKKKVRRMKNKKQHKLWAKSVNLQILKAEIVIKVHKVFNYLNES